MSGYDLPPDSPGFAEAQAKMSQLSKPLADFSGAYLDVPYGDHPRQRLDVFPAGPGCPAILFLRGGYWRAGNKEERHFPASEWATRGVTWIVPNYRLAPEASLPEIVEDACSALKCVFASEQEFGVDPTQIHLCGNSAGAHLAAMVAASPLATKICSLTLLSGLYDLQPLIGEAPNTWLNMNTETAKSMSPALNLPSKDIPITVCVGGTEAPEFIQQSREYAQRLNQSGSAVEYFKSPGKNHMEIILECGTPGTPVFEALERHLAR